MYPMVLYGLNRQFFEICTFSIVNMETVLFQLSDRNIWSNEILST